LKASFFKYLTVVCLLVAMLESNHIPVVSAFGMHMQSAQQSDDENAEDPVKESEVRVESVKDYFHELIAFNFTQPVFLLSVKHPVFVKTKFPFCFYPDVPTPPPNC
jgi:hypothetical protein